MGLLDDAIREHLELKRRRGADPDEVARQEDEALGDPRSGEFARPDGEVEPAMVEPVAAEPEAEPIPPEEDLPPEPPEPAAFEPEPAEPPDAPWLEDDEPVAEEPTAVHEPAEPEHDRLWFEQKPPRDFDFDK